MEVILVQPIRKLGKIGELVKVKDGFGRNYLIPKNLAIRATEHNKDLMEQQKAELESKNAQAKLNSEAVAKTINDKEIIFVRQSAADGRLFGSVTTKDIAKALSELSKHDVLSSSIILEHQIKFLGIFSVEVILHAEVTAKVLVSVGRTETEAKAALTAHKTSKVEGSKAESGSEEVEEGSNNDENAA